MQIFPDDKGTHYILEVVAGDRPGLLARIAYTLAKANVNVASAKINTLGERAEDVFLIDGARLHDEQALLRLETALYEQLRRESAPERRATVCNRRKCDRAPPASPRRGSHGPLAFLRRDLLVGDARQSPETARR